MHEHPDEPPRQDAAAEESPDREQQVDKTQKKDPKSPPPLMSFHGVKVDGAFY